MVKKGIINRNFLTFVTVVWLMLAAMSAGVAILHGTAVFAQSADGDEGGIEIEEVEDQAEGVDVPITGAALEQASAAALTFIGEGQVTGSEVGDEEGYYEIEVMLENGRQVDVHLDAAFNILGQKTD